MFSLSTILSLAGVYLFIFLFDFCENDRIPPRYVINLDTEPENRWDEAIEDHMDFIPAVIDEIKHTVPKFIRSLLWWIDEKILLRKFPEEYARELQGIAARSGLRVGEVVGINIFYDITAFRRGHIMTNVGCTSIVAEDFSGKIIHGRNLDYEMPSLLRNLTIIADFMRNDKIIFTAVTFVLNIGIFTGQRHGSFSISLNERYSGAYIDTILMELYTHFKRPISFGIRKALEEIDNFEEAKNVLMQEFFVAPSYLIIAGTKSGQGCVIVRNRLITAGVKCIDREKGQWFVVETNFDYWEKDKDKRRITAEKALQKIGQKAMSYKKMLQVLSESPVENK